MKNESNDCHGQRLSPLLFLGVVPYRRSHCYLMLCFCRCEGPFLAPRLTFGMTSKQLSTAARLMSTVHVPVGLLDVLPLIQYLSYLLLDCWHSKNTSNTGPVALSTSHPRPASCLPEPARAPQSSDSRRQITSLLAPELQHHQPSHLCLLCWQCNPWSQVLVTYELQKTTERQPTLSASTIGPRRQRARITKVKRPGGKG